ncbi:MAG: tRNA (adenosine(37)-N6)-threonylcarbamoyltransferase complex dimerization subunit type 1 TsaB [Leptospira sp.]|nr:tRNA (adenosine(37)-N6)-threonylcarbamoyltransferase complex dimerization subunit type 1 TsaB [Leptospira sp.]
MRVLFFDTTQDWIFVGVYELTNLGSSVLYERVSTSPKESSFKLVSYIEEALSKTETSKPDCIFVPAGPGSFTGIRITVTTARDLSQLWNIPCLGRDSLEVYLLSIHHQWLSERTGESFPNKNLSNNLAVAVDGKQAKYFVKYGNLHSFSKSLDLKLDKIQNLRELESVSPNAKFIISKNTPENLKNWYPLEIESLRFNQVLWVMKDQLLNLNLSDSNYQTLLPNYIRGTYVD